MKMINSNMRKYRIAVLFTLFVCVFAHAEIGAGFETGVGVRALALANNHVAVANDMSASYWNPAALALLPVREVQLAFDMLRVSGSSDFSGRHVTIPSGAKSEDAIERIRLNGVGYMTALPTTQGGLTLALSFDRPYAFDNVSRYDFNEIQDGTRYYCSQNDRRNGDLNRWTGAFGVQVTEQISAGLSVSMVTGKETAPILLTMSDGTEYVYYDSIIHSSKYLGVAMTGGFLYYPIDILKVGMRVNAAINMGVNESWAGKELTHNGLEPLADPPVTSRAYTAPNGTLGAALNLPWLTLALDLRLTMPYTFVLPGEDIPDDIQAKQYKIGAGMGVEVPIPSIPVVLRTGYSFDEYDLYPIVHEFGDDGIEWLLDGYYKPSVSRNKHTLSVGGAVFTSGFGFELAYAYQTWGVAFDYSDGGNWHRLVQHYSGHRLATAVIFRY